MKAIPEPEGGTGNRAAIFSQGQQAQPSCVRKFGYGRPHGDPLKIRCCRAAHGAVNRLLYSRAGRPARDAEPCDRWSAARRCNRKSALGRAGRHRGAVRYGTPSDLRFRGTARGGGRMDGRQRQSCGIKFTGTGYHLLHDHGGGCLRDAMISFRPNDLWPMPTRSLSHARQLCGETRSPPRPDSVSRHDLRGVFAQAGQLACFGQDGRCLPLIGTRTHRTAARRLTVPQGQGRSWSIPQ
jgi:hypothetical protein